MFSKCGGLLERALIMMENSTLTITNFAIFWTLQWVSRCAESLLIMLLYFNHFSTPSPKLFCWTGPGPLNVDQAHAAKCHALRIISRPAGAISESNARLKQHMMTSTSRKAPSARDRIKIQDRSSPGAESDQDGGPQFKSRTC